jgi:hypothetical protein
MRKQVNHLHVSLCFDFQNMNDDCDEHYFTAPDSIATSKGFTSSQNDDNHNEGEHIPQMRSSTPERAQLPEKDTKVRSIFGDFAVTNDITVSRR